MTTCMSIRVSVCLSVCLSVTLGIAAISTNQGGSEEKCLGQFKNPMKLPLHPDWNRRRTSAPIPLGPGSSSVWWWLDQFRNGRGGLLWLGSQPQMLTVLQGVTFMPLIEKLHHCIIKNNWQLSFQQHLHTPNQRLTMNTATMSCTHKHNSRPLQLVKIHSSSYKTFYTVWWSTTIHTVRDV